MSSRTGTVRGRLLRASMIPAGVSFLLGSVLVAGFLWREVERRAVENVSALGAVIAEAAAPFLAFSDPLGIEAVLEPARTQPSIVGVLLLDGNGVAFGGLGSLTATPDPALISDGPSISGTELRVATPVRSGDERVGTLILVSDLSEVTTLRVKLILGLMAMLVLGLGTAMYLTLRLSRSIIEPIEKLSAVAAAVSGDKDSAARAPTDADDEIGRLGAVFNEMLDRIGTHDRLVREREQYFRSLIERSSDVIAVLREDGRITYVSPSVERVTGQTPEEWVGRDFRQLIHSEDGNALDDLLAASENGDAVPVNLRFGGPGGETRVLEAVATRAGEAGMGWILNARDITERENLREQLAHSQRLEAVGKLTGGVAHDFNNLLQVILGNLELLEDDADRAGISGTEIDIARRAAERGARLTQRLLAFSRKQTLRPEAVEVRRLVEAMTVLMRRTLGEAIEIRVTGRDDHATCMLDRAQMENALLNLAINARDAMPDGGVLEIGCGLREISGGETEFGTEVPAGQWVEVKVTDTGCGMPVHILERVFEPFFTTKEVGRGSGLGMSMVFGFVKQSDGYLSIESEPGHGTSITMIFPAVRRQAARLEPIRTRPETRPGEGTVLLVEDSDEVRALVARIVADLGLTVISARSGAEVLRKKDEQLREVDLILSDVVMPEGVNGVQMVAALERRGLTPDVVFMSGYPRDALPETLSDDTVLIAKPFSRSDLATVIRNRLQARQTRINR